MLIVRQIENPILAICRLIENSVQAGASKIQVSLTNLANTNECLFVKDNGPGISNF
jgi:DNA mismatch repair ATPase MutL